MVHKIVYKSSVSRDLRHIDPKRAGRILSEIKEVLDKNPRAGEPLSGEFKGLYKLRIGEYRVIYAKINDTLLVLLIRHRSKVYA
ncbi:MAG: type II toxin-antitoxin system RelE/ParE family toxin [Thaumarchaeota archaeon]|nr:type II toxin-antitoxin system RelE/ParE family toxin [Nitrososphaerota archaeon]